MKKLLLSTALTLGTLASGSLLAAAPAQAGCVSGAIIGGIAGHVLGHHGVAGAAAGCAIGSLHRHHSWHRGYVHHRYYRY